MLPEWTHILRGWIDPAVRTLLTVPAAVIVFYLFRFLFATRLPFRVIRMRDGLGSSAISSSQPKWYRHLVFLTRSVSQGESNDDERVQAFVLYSAATFSSVYLPLVFWSFTSGEGPLMYRLFDKWAVTMALMASALPYGIMRLRLHGVRVRNSHELVPAVNLLVMKYGQYRGNLYYAVFETAKELKGDIGAAFVSLLPALQGSSNAALSDAVELFIYRVRTSWAVQLGILIQKSEEQGDNIEQGLRWLISDMSEVANITEEVKSENREAVQLALLPVILLPLVVFLNQYPSMGKSWYYYFHHPSGVRILLFTVLFSTLCSVTALIIQKPRNQI